MTSRHFRRRHQRGASLVELALVLFILLFIFAGIVDFGRVFNHYVVITNASREGARYASRYAYEYAPERYRKGILLAAKQETVGSSVELEDDNIAIDPDPYPADGTGGSVVEAGGTITVTVSYTVPTIIADIANFGFLPLRAQTSMVVFGVGENQ